MMRTTISSVLCIATMIALGVTVDAVRRPKIKKQEFTPPPTATPPLVPSVDLSRFISANLDKILGPLGQKAALPRVELAQLRASFSVRFSKASLADRPQFQTAIAVCDALSQAMDERDKAMLNPAASDWPLRTLQLRQNIEELAARERATEGQSASTPTPSRP
jgi:hypothetical protein